HLRRGRAPLRHPHPRACDPGGCLAAQPVCRGAVRAPRRRQVHPLPAPAAAGATGGAAVPRKRPDLARLHGGPDRGAGAPGGSGGHLAGEPDLQEREAKVRRLVDVNSIGIVIWDRNGRIIEANDAFLGMVGYTRDDLAAGGMRWTDMTPPEWHASDQRWFAEVKVTGRSEPVETAYDRRDGSRVPVRVGAAALAGGGDQGVAFMLDL